MDRDRVPAGPVQRGAVVGMPTSLVAFWWSVVVLERDDGDLGRVLAVGLVLTVVPALVGMWVAGTRPYTLGLAVGAALGVGAAVLVAGGLYATSVAGG